MDGATATMLSELEVVRQAEARGWWRIIEVDEVTPSFTISMTSRPTAQSPAGDEYVWLVECDGYRSQPPFFHCVDPRTRELDTKLGFPGRGGDSFFNEHGGKPVICNQFNRGAYVGIHKGDWGPQVGNWESMAGLNTRLHAMLAAIRSRIWDEKYTGPWEARR